MDLFVSRRRDSCQARYGVHRFRCAVGRGGVTRNKREGDGTTPIGCWPMRYVLFRPDRLDPPETELPVRALAPQLGWCDDPADAAYNKPVALSYAGRHEVMWRDDEVYDLLVVLGYNDAPVLPGRGSAIFLHVARPGYPPTEGCIALALADLERVLVSARPGARVCVLSD